MVGNSLKADILGAKMLDILSIWKPKASLIKEARVAWMASHEASKNESVTGFTDDHLLVYVHNRDALKLQQLHFDLKPDFIIKNLQDLLTISKSATFAKTELD